MPTAQVMSLSIAVTHSQVLPLVLSRSAGLRLLGSGSHSSCLVTARRLWSHLACAVSPRGCVVFHPAANPAVKLTRQRRAAYFRSLGSFVATVENQELQVRPALRIIGAVFMLLLSALMIHSSIPFFSARRISLKSCTGEYKASSQFLCEIGNAMMSMLPAWMQGPTEGLIHLAMAALLIWLSWLLTKSLFARA